MSGDERERPASKGAERERCVSVCVGVCVCVCVCVHCDVYADMCVCGVREYMQSVCVSHDHPTQHSTVPHSTA